MIKVIVNNVIANATNLEVLTAGMVKGRAIEFDLSPEWEELNKTAVFTNGLETRIVPEHKWTDRRIVYIPPEVLSTPHQFVKCGIYGIDTEDKLVIPTLWAEIGRVFPSASPNEYEESVPPTPNTWDDLQSQIGNVKDLLTEDKRNLVEAINEIARKNTEVASYMVYRATDYGISTESADNKAALQKLVDDVSAAGGGIIFFPVGVYKFKPGYWTGPHRSIISMKSNVSIVGENIETTILKQVGGETSSLFYYRGTAETPITGGCFSNFTVDAYETGNTNYVFGKAFFFQYVKDCVFRDLRLMGTVATAMGIDFLDRVVIDNVSCIDCGRTFTGKQAGTSGIGIGTAGWENENFIITNCVCSGCGQYGIFIENQGIFGDGNVAYAKGCVIANCVVRNGLNKGIGIRGGENVTVIGCEVYENETHGFYIDNNCKNIKIMSSSSTKNGVCGICIEPNVVSNGIIIRDCQFIDNTTQAIAINKPSIYMCLMNNYTKGNALGLKIEDGAFTDCVIKGNVFFDGEEIKGVFTGDTRYNDYPTTIPVITTNVITSDMYTNDIKLLGDGSMVSEVGMKTIVNYIDVSELPDSFVFKFDGTANTNLRIAQYDENKASLSDSFGIPWVVDKTSITINKLEGCKYIRICGGNPPTGMLESVEPKNPTTITADMYTSGIKLMPDGSTTSQPGSYCIVDYIDVSELSDSFIFEFEGSVNGNLRIAQYDENKTSLSDSFGIPQVNGATRFTVQKLEGCKYIRISSSVLIEGKLESVASNIIIVPYSSMTNGKKLMLDGSLADGTLNVHKSTEEYIDVSMLNDTFGLFYPAKEDGSSRGDIRIAQYDSNKNSLATDFGLLRATKTTDGYDIWEVTKLEGCRYIRIFLNGGSFSNLDGELRNLD